MKKTAAVLALFALILLIAWFLAPSLASLPTATPPEMGLLWQECLLSQDLGTWQQAAECFGQPQPVWEEAEKANYAQRTDMQNFRLSIGPDSFDTSLVVDLLGYEIFGLYKNGWPLSVLGGNFYAHSPNIGLQAVGGKPAWEFADDTQATLVYDGQDVRRLYGLDRASSPYELDHRLIFMGQKGTSHFVVYNGKRLSPEFDEVLVAYCCEAVLYSPRGLQGRYLFNATRAGQHYLVEVTSARP